MENNNKQITEYLLNFRDLKYKNFNEKLIPNIDACKIIGVRMPEIRRIAKEFHKNPDMQKSISEFMQKLPHSYLEEDHLHGCFINLMAKTPKQALSMVDDFLPYVDNWATCDSLPPKILKKDTILLRNTIIPWLESTQVYRVRFAIVSMLKFLMDDDFRKEDLKLVGSVNLDDYYIKMAVAWYYSVALAKQYDLTVKIFENSLADKWIHNKSIQKATESYCIGAERKDYLRSLKIK